jgi:RNA recognition motif-containing protein
VTRLFIAGLGHDASVDAVNALLAPYARPRMVRVPVDRDTLEPRGFAFAELTDDAAQAAIQGLDGTEVNDRRIRVQVARPRIADTDGGR